MSSLIAEHDEMRVHLAHARVLSDCVDAGDGDAAAELRAVVQIIRMTLEAHLAREERLLLPLLRRIDPIGVDRARSLRSDHDSQRQALRVLERGPPAGGDDDRSLARAARGLVAELLVEMLYEERDLLASPLLADDGLGRLG